MICTKLHFFVFCTTGNLNVMHDMQKEYAYEYMKKEIAILKVFTTYIKTNKSLSQMNMYNNL